MLAGGPGEEAITDKAGDTRAKQLRRWETLDKRKNLTGDALKEWEALSKKYNKGIFGVAKNTMEDAAKKSVEIQEKMQTAIDTIKPKSIR